jgi:hypothetical protein
VNLDNASGPKAMRSPSNGMLRPPMKPFFGGYCLEPASAPVPSASKNEHNEKDDDEKCGVIHVDLLRFESKK